MSSSQEGTEWGDPCSFFPRHPHNSGTSSLPTFSPSSRMFKGVALQRLIIPRTVCGFADDRLKYVSYKKPLSRGSLLSL